jgi:hypothetical protein
MGPCVLSKQLAGLRGGQGAWLWGICARCLVPPPTSPFVACYEESAMLREWCTEKNASSCVPSHIDESYESYASYGSYVSCVCYVSSVSYVSYVSCALCIVSYVS